MKPLTYTELRLFRLIWSWLPAAIKRRVMQRILTQFVPSADKSCQRPQILTHNTQNQWKPTQKQQQSGC